MTHGKVTKVAVLSSTAFGYQCLKEAILGTPGIQVVGILTTPPEINIPRWGKPMIIKKHSIFDNFQLEAGCDVVVMRDKITTSYYLRYLEHWHPDLLLVLGWYYLIPRKVRESALLGCAGIHASLLPKYRGGAPIPWAIINGEKETGVTFFHMDDGVDSGDIIAQGSFAIEESDNCATVYEKATLASIKILREYLPRIAMGTAPRIPQNQDKATYFPLRRPEDGLIDWSWSAKRIRDFVRAQTHPYPGAFTYIEGKKVIIWDAEVMETNHY